MSSMPVGQYGALTGAPSTLNIGSVRSTSFSRMGKHERKRSTGLSYTQYIALGPWPSKNFSPLIGQKNDRPSPACIQIWSLSSEHSETDKGKVRKQINPQHMRCELVLCVDVGPSHDLRWCPLPSHGDVSLFFSLHGSRKLTSQAVHNSPPTRKSAKAWTARWDISGRILINLLRAFPAGCQTRVRLY
jgi:hypothetical protein